MKKRPANKAFALLLSMLLCASLATIQVPWAAYAVDEAEPSAESGETVINGVDDDADENSLESDELDADEEELPTETEPTLLGDVIYIANEAVELEDKEQQDSELIVQADGDIASGTLGDCNWAIDADGTLTITPGTGNSFAANWQQNYDVPWRSFRERIITVHIPQLIHASGSLHGMFDCCSYLTSLDLSGLDTSSVTDMSNMFYFCSSLASLDLSGLDTSSVTDMSEMFARCPSLTSLDLSGLDTSSVTDMSDMFDDCPSLASLDLSGLDTSSVTDMSGMFVHCPSLTSLDLSGLDTSSVTDMSDMFVDCPSLASLDLSDFDTSSVTDMGGMFFGCSSLASLDLSGFGTSSVTDMEYMFYGCSSLDTVKLGSNFSFKGANGLTGDSMTELPDGNWLSDVANKNQIYTASQIAQDRNDLADTYYKVNLVKNVSVTGIDAPTAEGVAKPVDLTLQAVNGALATNAVTSSWQGDFAKDADGNDVFVAGNTYTLPVSVMLGNRFVRDNGFALSAPDGFIVMPGTYNGSPVGPMGQTCAFTLSYTVPPAGEHVVTLDPGNGDAVTNVKVADGEKLQRPADPIREGYSFDGWLLDGNPYDFDAPVTSNMTLTAKWVEQEVPAAAPSESESTGLPPKTMDIVGWSAGLVLLACALAALAIGINRRKAYEAARSHFHYERYGYLNERKRSPFRRLRR